jgi:hypothetical protein
MNENEEIKKIDQLVEKQNEIQETLLKIGKKYSINFQYVKILVEFF